MRIIKFNEIEKPVVGIPTLFALPLFFFPNLRDSSLVFCAICVITKAALITRYVALRKT